jgi:hypothetical protein
VRLLATAADATLARTAVHPRLRRSMRLIDLAEFIAGHDDYHLAVITELTAWRSSLGPHLARPVDAGDHASTGLTLVLRRGHRGAR